MAKRGFVRDARMAVKRNPLGASCSRSSSRRCDLGSLDSARPRARYCGNPHTAKSSWGDVGQDGQPENATKLDEGP
jgi:hypothetical protein